MATSLRGQSAGLAPKLLIFMKVGADPSDFSWHITSADAEYVSP